MRLHLVHDQDAFITLIFTDDPSNPKALDLGTVGTTLLGLVGPYAAPCITVRGSSVAGSHITSDGEELELAGIQVWAEYGGPGGKKLQGFLNSRQQTWETYLRLNGMKTTDATSEYVNSAPAEYLTEEEAEAYEVWAQSEKNPAIRLINAINAINGVSVEF